MHNTTDPFARNSGLTIRISALVALAKSLDRSLFDEPAAQPSKLKGKKRVGGTGASHKGSHWEHAQGDTVSIKTPHHGARDALVIAKQKNQSKAFVPGLGMFAVDHADVSEPVGPRLAWDRLHATGVQPAVGSLVNVKRPEDTQAKIMRLDEELPEDLATHVRVSTGTVGRKREELTVERGHILGAHVPRLVKNTEGRFVRDTNTRKTEAGTALDEVKTGCAKWRRRSALEWVNTLRPGRRKAITAEEAAWFRLHQDRIINIAGKQARNAEITDPNAIDDIISETLHGALSGLRLWERRPAKSRGWVAARMIKAQIRAHAKKGEDVSDLEVAANVAGLTDDVLKLQRVVWRAFTKARSASHAVARGHLAGDRSAEKRGPRMIVADDEADRRAHEIRAFELGEDETTMPYTPRPLILQGAPLEDDDEGDEDDELESVAGTFTARDDDDDDVPAELSTPTVGPNRRLQLAHLAEVIGNRIAGAARLTDAEKYVLQQAMALRWEDHDAGMSASNHTPIPASDAAEVVAELRKRFKITVEAEQLPRVWSSVKRKLRDAARDNPHLLVPILGLPKVTREERDLTRVVGDEVAELLDDPLEAISDRAAQALKNPTGSMFDLDDDGAWDTGALESANLRTAASRGNLGPVLRKSLHGSPTARPNSRTAAILAAFAEHSPLGS